MIIHTYVDDILRRVLKNLNVTFIEYTTAIDPVMKTHNMLSNFNYNFSPPAGVIEQLPDDFEPLEWSILEEWVKDKDLLNKMKNKKIVNKVGKPKRKKPQEEIGSKLLKKSFNRNVNIVDQSKLNSKQEAELKRLEVEKEIKEISAVFAKGAVRAIEDDNKQDLLRFPQPDIIDLSNARPHSSSAQRALNFAEALNLIVWPLKAEDKKAEDAKNGMGDKFFPKHE